MNLQRLCRLDNFVSIIQRCTSHRQEVAVEEAQHPDSCRWLPLHWISGSTSKSPLRSQATKSILDAYPDGAAALDSAGCTPLHHACKKGHVRTDSNIPNLEILVEAYPAALSTQDNLGRAPLDYAVTRQPSTGVLRVLISSDPNSATIVPENSKSPLHVAWDNVSGEEPWVRYPERWNAAMLLLKAVYHRTTNFEDENDFPYVLHAALSFCLPKKVIDYALERNPDSHALPDLHTSLYPCMLAATHAPNGEEIEHDEDLRQLDMIFDLLSRDASVVNPREKEDSHSDHFLASGCAKEN